MLPKHIKCFNGWEGDRTFLGVYNTRTLKNLITPHLHQPNIILAQSLSTPALEPYLTITTNSGQEPKFCDTQPELRSPKAGKKQHRDTLQLLKEILLSSLIA